MKLLAIDTATSFASVAVVGFDHGAARALATVEVETDRHSERLLPAIEHALATARCALDELDAVAVGAGPGSFTGLRIGLATAKGIAFAAGKPLWMASSLQALAWDLAATASAEVLVAALDARRDEIYVGVFERRGAGVVALAPERVVPPGELAAILAACTDGERAVEIAGDAITVYGGALACPPHVRLRADVRATPSGFGLGCAAAAGDRRDVLALGAPAYIRRAEAEVLYPNGVPGAMPRPV